jgi:hypothetical protein
MLVLLLLLPATTGLPLMLELLDRLPDRTTLRLLSLSLSSAARFSSLTVGVLGGAAVEMGYTVDIWGRMKCARFSGFWSSSVVVGVGIWAGRKRVKRERRVCWGGGGLLRIDFPGMGIVTADEDGSGEFISARNGKVGLVAFIGVCKYRLCVM